MFEELGGFQVIMAMSREAVTQAHGCCTDNMIWVEPRNSLVDRNGNWVGYRRCTKMPIWKKDLAE